MKAKGMWWFLLLALSAPCQAGENMKESATLKPDEGVLVTTVRCGHPVTGMQLYAPGKSAKGLKGMVKFDELLTCAPGIKTVRTKAGRYYIGLLYGRGGPKLVLEEQDAPHFTVEPGKLNYVGDIYAGDVSPFEVDQETLLRISGRSLAVMDREPEARAVLEQQYPWLLARYPFATALADKALSRPSTSAKAPEPVPPGYSTGLMRLGSSHWTRSPEGEPRICPRWVPLPKGTKPAPDEKRVCDGDYQAPQEFIQMRFGPEAKFVAATPSPDDDSVLILRFLLPPKQR